MRWRAGTPKLSAVLATLAASALAISACSSAKHVAAPTSATTTTTVAPFPFDLGTTATTTTTGTNTTNSTNSSNSTGSTAVATTTAAPTTTVAPNPGRVCAPTELAVTGATDRPIYTAGQTMAVAISIRSRSATECTIDRRATLSIVEPVGKVAVGGQQSVDRFVGAGGLIRPTQSFTLTFTWDLIGCSGAGGRCLPGQYTAAATLGEIQVPVSFKLA